MGQAMTDNLTLASEWAERCESYAAAHNMREEARKMWIDAIKHHDHSLRRDGDRAWRNAEQMTKKLRGCWTDAVKNAYGEKSYFWKGRDCHIITNGEVYKFIDSRKE
jgi:hypothetical protein